MESSAGKNSVFRIPISIRSKYVAFLCSFAYLFLDVRSFALKRECHPVVDHGGWRTVCYERVHVVHLSGVQIEGRGESAFT